MMFARFSFDARIFLFTFRGKCGIILSNPDYIMTDNIKKFIEEIAVRIASSPKGKIPSALYFEIGKTFGMTCKEVVETKKEHFADQTRKKTKKVVARKDAKKAPESKEVMVESVEGCDESSGVVENSDSSFVWIATPEEIQSTEDL
jgi:hypothetical protein